MFSILIINIFLFLGASNYATETFPETPETEETDPLPEVIIIQDGIGG